MLCCAVLCDFFCLYYFSMHLFAIKKGAQQPMDLISFRLPVVAVVGLIDPELFFNPLFLKS